MFITSGLRNSAKKKIVRERRARPLQVKRENLPQRQIAIVTSIVIVCDLQKTVHNFVIREEINPISLDPDSASLLTSSNDDHSR